MGLLTFTIILYILKRLARYLPAPIYNRLPSLPDPPPLPYHVRRVLQYPACMLKALRMPRLTPMLTAVLQATFLSALSNILAQLIRSYREHPSRLQSFSPSKFQFDAVEFTRYLLLTLVTCPPNYKWQQWLERTFPAYPRDAAPDLPMTEKLSEKGRRRSGDGVDIDLDTEREMMDIGKPRLSVKNTAAKWFIDCITVGALLNTVAFFVIMGMLKGYAWPVILDSVRTKTIPLILNSYKIWPIVSVINFSFIPVEKRIVFLSTVGLFWGVYISLVAAKV